MGRANRMVRANQIFGCFFIPAICLSVGSCSKIVESAAVKGETAFEDYYWAYSPSCDESTKTFTDLQGLIYWNEGDCISVFSGPENEQWNYDGETGDLANKFVKAQGSSGNTSEYGKNYALYPYSDSVSSTSEGTISFILPSVQRYKKDSFGIGANPMVAVTADRNDRELHFKNICGFIQLELYGSCAISKIRIYGNNGEKLSGPANLSCGYNQKPSVSVADTDTSCVVVLDCGNEGISLENDVAKAKKFIIALPPTDFTQGFTVEIENTDHKTMKRSTNRNVCIQRSVVTPMAVFQVICTITNINGTDILEGNRIIGLITDKSTGKGIADVPVTDGYTYTLTDRNGVYQMEGNQKCRKVYYSLPSGYQTAMDADYAPLFYSVVPIDMSTVNRNDFVLEPKSADETNWTLIGISDPQPNTSAKVDRYKNEIVADIVTAVNDGQAEGLFSNAYAVTLGDVAYNKPSLYPSLKESMSNVKLASGRYIPFYQCPGNHDHTYGNTQYESLADFINTFGPTDYSFNIGEAHIVVMDNYIANNWSGTTGGSYTCGLTDEQYQWLCQDISMVQDKENKLVILCEHAPFGEGNGDSDHVHKKNHYDDILNLLTGFHDAHLLAGHTHRWHNVVHNEFICKSGRPIYDHNQNASCGWMWDYGKLAPDGSPEGYCIYEIKGNEIYNWTSKASGFPLNYQMRVYDGNQVYTGSDSRSYSWYDTSTASGSYAKAVLKDCFVVTLWDGDETNWSVELFVEGQKAGDLSVVPKKCADVCAQAYMKGWSFSYAQDAQHYWYIKAPNGDPSTLGNWEIRATQTIPSSTRKVNVYSCTSLQTDFTGFY